MDFDQQLKQVMQDLVNKNLAIWTKRLGSESRARIFLRNRAIEQVARSYDSCHPDNLYYPKIYHDLVIGEDSVFHYGRAEGTRICAFRKRRKDYYSLFGALVAILRTMAIELNLAKTEVS